MSNIIGLVAFIGGIVFLARNVSQARISAFTGPRTRGMRDRAAAGGPPRTFRQDLAHMRERARLDDWLDSRRHHRTLAAPGRTVSTGSTVPAAPGTGAAPYATPPDDPPRRRVLPGRLRHFQPVTTSGPNGNGSGPPPGPRICTCGRSLLPGGFCSGCRRADTCSCAPLGTPAPPRRGSGVHTAPAPPPAAPARQPGPPAPGRDASAVTGQPPRETNGNDGRNTVTAGTSTASAEKMIEGINEIHASAAAGNIHAKRAALKAIHEAIIRFAAMLQMLSRQMSEPGSNYGPEITEPIAQAGTHQQASAMSVSDADAAISTLINMSVGDLANSPRQAPHNNELSETGAR